MSSKPKEFDMTHRDWLSGLHWVRSPSHSRGSGVVRLIVGGICWCLMASKGGDGLYSPAALTDDLSWTWSN